MFNDSYRREFPLFWQAVKRKYAARPDGWKLLNADAADALFKENAVFMNGRDVIPWSVAFKLFGYDICAHVQQYDWDSSADRSERPLMLNQEAEDIGIGHVFYMTRNGFNRAVMLANMTVLWPEQESESRAYFDDLVNASRAAEEKLEAERRARREKRRQKAQERKEREVSEKAEIA